MDADLKMLSTNSPLQGLDILYKQDSRAYFDSDLTRLLVLYQMGGVWIDFDVLLLRDFSPLLHKEFVHEWYVNFKILMNQ